MGQAAGCFTRGVDPRFLAETKIKESAVKISGPHLFSNLYRADIT